MSKEEAIKILSEMRSEYNLFGDEEEATRYHVLSWAIKEMNAEPVRHGHWCATQAYPHTIYCSECFQRFAQAHWAIWEDGSLPRDYCPHCGAKMDEVAEDV